MTRKEKGWAAIWAILVAGAIVACLAKDALQFVLAALAIAALCGIGALAEIMGFDPRPDHEKKAGQELARRSKARTAQPDSITSKQPPPIH